MDPSGRIAVSSSLYPAAQSGSSTPLQTYYRVAVPDLRVEATCSYAPLTGTSSSNASTITNTIEESCSEFAEGGGLSSAIEMDKLARNDTDPPKPPFPVRDYLGWRFVYGGSSTWLGMSANFEDLAVLTSKGDVAHRFASASMGGKQPVRGPAWICGCELVGGAVTNAIVDCSTSHDNLFGWSVGLRQWIAEADVEHERDLSSVEIPIRDNFEAKISDIGSQKLLLVVLNGSRLEVYSLSAPS